LVRAKLQILMAIRLSDSWPIRPFCFAAGVFSLFFSQPNLGGRLIDRH